MSDDTAHQRTARSTGRGRRGAMSITRLVVLSSPDTAAIGRPVLLDGRALVMGRAGHARGALALDDAELSRQHLSIEQPDADGSGWQLRDLGSTNGSHVGGERVDRRTLHHGDVLRAGGTVLLFERHEVEAGSALAPAEPPLLGPSVGLQRVRGEIQRVAAQPVSVLILGESGVGKELCADALHRASGRHGRFIPVNCGALPENLIESELFGHVAGAFTGATRDRPGLVQAAAGGTLFLDEIGEMPVSLQPRLLRLLATGEVRPVGGSKTNTVDVRVVAATNRVDMSVEVEEGRLRGDLYARLAGWTIVIPPLRERRQDILALGRHFASDMGCEAPWDPDVAEALALAAWPYNVRQLRQVVQAALVRSGGAALGLADLPPGLAGPVEARLPELSRESGEPPLALLVRRDATPTREELALVLRRFGGNVAQAADFFGKDRRQVYRWGARLDLDPEHFRPVLD